MSHVATIQPVTLDYNDGTLTVSCRRVGGTRKAMVYDVPEDMRDWVRGMVAACVEVTNLPIHKPPRRRKWTPLVAVTKEKE